MECPTAHLAAHASASPVHCHAGTYSSWGKCMFLHFRVQSETQRVTLSLMCILAGLILGVVVINIAIGLMQEGKAEKAADAIKAMLSASAMVIRGGKRFSVDADLLVPGDIVTIKSGDRLPADIRLLELSNLQVLEVRTCEWKEGRNRSL